MALPMVPEWSLGDRLRKARTIAGLTVEQLAVAIHTTSKTVHKYEHDQVKKPNGVLVARWSDATGVSRDWLFEGLSSLVSRWELPNFQPSLFDDEAVVHSPNFGAAPTPTGRPFYQHEKIPA